MVLPPTLQRHDLVKSIHATFLYPTARLPPLFDAVASGARRTSEARSCSLPTTWILGAYPFSSRCTTKSTAKKSPTGSLPPAVPLATTRTFRPWTHTSDDSYIYQLSLVVATATASLRQVMLFAIPQKTNYAERIASTMDISLHADRHEQQLVEEGDKTSFLLRAWDWRWRRKCVPRNHRPSKRSIIVIHLPHEQEEKK